MRPRRHEGARRSRKEFSLHLSTFVNPSCSFVPSWLIPHFRISSVSLCLCDSVAHCSSDSLEQVENLLADGFEEVRMNWPEPTEGRAGGADERA
jgi:hypothetical protein